MTMRNPYLIFFILVIVNFTKSETIPEDELVRKISQFANVQVSESENSAHLKRGGRKELYENFIKSFENFNETLLLNLDTNITSSSPAQNFELFLKDYDSVRDFSDNRTNHRRPKFLSFFKRIFQELPTYPRPQNYQNKPENKQNSLSPNYNDAITNYEQYFKQSDPYNQNQLLSSIPSSSPYESSVKNQPIREQQISSQSETSSSGGSSSLIGLFSKLIGDEPTSPTSVISNIMALGTGSFENYLKKVNKFDSLKCIPRLLCQTIAQRQQSEDGSKTTEKSREFRTFRGFPKIQGVDAALGQFMTFLDLVQLKDWSLYPYVKGAYEGAQVKRWDECAGKFDSCPFSDQQLVYYFNNYNGGFFSSLRSK